MNSPNNRMVWMPSESAYVRVTSVNGKDAPIVVLKSPKTQQYAGFRLIAKDLKTIKQVIQRLKSFKTTEENYIDKTSLAFFAVITYGKCYTQSDGRGTKLDLSAATKYATAEQLKAHQEIIKLRDSYVAHSGLEGAEQNIVVAALNPEDPKSVIAVYDTMYDLTDLDFILNDFEGLIDSVFKYVKEKYEKLYKLITDEVAAVNIDDHYKNAVDVSTLREDNFEGLKR